MWQGIMALWVSGVPLCGAPDACAYQPRQVQSVGELVVCRASGSLIPALGTPIGAQWCKGVKSGLARQGQTHTYTHPHTQFAKARHKAFLLE